ncbi:MAG: hypothetical protein A3J76_04550 [Candidatus Moranbacteria bacterium RBG_13_45_13]|nr:MAG: hypothetical protein A3J76_04550 [Candidatus Moranbacteria bacterium RBG_13_45_13]
MANIIKTILLAAIAAAIALLVEQIAATIVSIYWHKEIVFEFYHQLTYFLVGAVIIEEISKYWAIAFVMRKKFDLSGLKFVLLSLLLGVSWGVFEVALILFSNQGYRAEFQSASSQLLFSLAAVISVHSLTAFLIGSFISAETFSGRLKSVKILFFPMLVHLLFNFLMIQKGDFTNYLITLSLAITFLVGIIIFAFNFKKFA